MDDVLAWLPTICAANNEDTVLCGRSCSKQRKQQATAQILTPDWPQFNQA